MAIMRMFLRPDARSHRIGKPLLQALLAETRATGYESHLLSSHHSLRHVRALHHRAEFRDLPRSDDLPGIVPEVDIRMERMPTDMISQETSLTDRADPFAHNPELRSRIADAETSFFRDFSVERVLEQNSELERFRAWVYSDDERETIRAEALAGQTGELWVFAYGSLMWDPALRFREVRHAFAPGHERRMILKDSRDGRGTEAAPGLMAALDTGDGCEGLAFRIAAADVDTETEILFRREMIGPGYVAGFVPVRIGETDTQALTFLADHGCPDICGDITRAEQVHCIATGAGMLGTSRDYLANIVDHFAHLDIHDTYCTELLREVDAYIAAQAHREPAR